MGRLDGKNAIVVGGGQHAGESVGNGRAAAITFAREGARVLVVDRDLDAAEATAEIIRSEGAEALTHRTDVASEDDCIELVARAQSVLGRVDILHNNVGIVELHDSHLELEEEGWDRIFDVNLKGMWHTCKYVIPIMRAQGQGAIINISSIGAVMLTPSVFAYSLTKQGVNGLTRHLALNNAAFGIRVNAVMPGLIHTPVYFDFAVRIRGVAREDVEKAGAAVPMGRAGTAWEIANAALFLASDEASFITGAVLPVDGGQSLK
jgi:NAD(P)-dependent dehydrogenase (short-subunit alcohol dehydrogenase family)